MASRTFCGSRFPLTTTFCVSSETEKSSTPSIFLSTRSTAPEQPPQLMATLSVTLRWENKRDDLGKEREKTSRARRQLAPRSGERSLPPDLPPSSSLLLLLPSQKQTPPLRAFSPPPDEPEQRIPPHPNQKCGKLALFRKKRPLPKKTETPADFLLARGAEEGEETRGSRGGCPRSRDEHAENRGRAREFRRERAQR